MAHSDALSRIHHSANSPLAAPPASDGHIADTSGSAAVAALRSTTPSDGLGSIADTDMTSTFSLHNIFPKMF